MYCQIKKSSLQTHFFCYNELMIKERTRHTDLLKIKRLKLGLSQSALAKKVGVSQQHWDRYEKGYPIPLEKVLSISNLLGISKWDLLPSEFTPQPTEYLNKTLLGEIIISIEHLIIEKKLQFSPEHKARLIILLYEKLSKRASNDNIQQNILSLITNLSFDQSA